MDVSVFNLKIYFADFYGKKIYSTKNVAQAKCKDITSKYSLPKFFHCLSTPFFMFFTSWDYGAPKFSIGKIIRTLAEFQLSFIALLIVT